jgi:hypothetical protein
VLTIDGDKPHNTTFNSIRRAAPPGATYAWVVSGSRNEPDDVLYYSTEAESRNDNGQNALGRRRFHRVVK